MLYLSFCYMIDTSFSRNSFINYKLLLKRAFIKPENIISYSRFENTEYFCKNKLIIFIFDFFLSQIIEKPFYLCLFCYMTTHGYSFIKIFTISIQFPKQAIIKPVFPELSFYSTITCLYFFNKNFTMSRLLFRQALKNPLAPY